MTASSEELWIRRLLDVGRELMSDVDLPAVLDRVLGAAQEITGARYAAVGILNDQRTELAQFLTAGVPQEIEQKIGDLPRGRGVLGLLIDHPQPLRLADVGQHPRSWGFPIGHPVMRSFLGVAIVIRGEAWGNLYLTEKPGGEFTEQDEEAAGILADWAAVAIDNAWQYEATVHRSEEVEKALRGLEATHDVTVAIGGEISFPHMLELIVKRGRALVGARSLVIMLRKGHELVVEASAGHLQDMQGARLSIAESSCGHVLEGRRAERITDVATRLGAPQELDVGEARTALLVPMLFRGDPVGVLAAFDRGEDQSAFSEDDEQMLGTFAASAATAVALAQSVQADRLRSAMAVADAERRRWARELHDETLQGLGGLRVLLSSALRRQQLEQAQTAMREAVEHIDREIANLRAIITELRPAALDELGLRTAIEALLDRHREQSGFEIDAELTLSTSSTTGTRLDDALETAVYRLVQEALTNAAKHARAGSVRVAVGESEGALLVEVSDNGGGFDPGSTSEGFGLTGMRERVGLAGGTLTVESDQSGTSIRARLPARLRQAAGDQSGARDAQHAAS
jgi:signal transduction histidine kinase